MDSLILNAILASNKSAMNNNHSESQLITMIKGLQSALEQSATQMAKLEAVIADSVIKAGGQTGGFKSGAESTAKANSAEVPSFSFGYTSNQGSTKASNVETPSFSFGPTSFDRL